MKAIEKINIIEKLVLRRNCPSDCGLKEDCQSHTSCEDCYTATIRDLLSEGGE